MTTETKIEFNREEILDGMTVLGSHQLCCIIVVPSESDPYEVDSDFETVVEELGNGIPHSGTVGHITPEIRAAIKCHLDA